MDSNTFREAGHRAIDFVADYYDNIATLPVRSDASPGHLLSQLRNHAPENSEDWADIENDLHQMIMPGLCHWMHPRYMAYFPASSTFEGILGELYSAAFNNPAFDWICSPAITELEIGMAAWVADLLHLPESFHASSHAHDSGVIMGSTTECLITTMSSARDRLLKNRKRPLEGRDTEEERLRARLVVLSSSETHVSTVKAASVVGVKHRSIACDPSSGIAMTGSHLKATIEQCHLEGLIPFYVTATFGTTNSCAVDDLESIADIKKTGPEIWVHVDAAYAGAALACDEWEQSALALKPLDSFSVNMGKWLLTNLDCTMLFTARNPDILGSMENSCTIVENEASKTRSVTDFRNLQLSMGRRFRSLKIWFMLRSWGKDRIRLNIRQHMRMAAQFTDWVRARPDLFTLVVKPQFALNVIRISDEAALQMDKDVNEATLELYSIIDASRDMWLSKTSVNGYMCIRVLAANPNSDIESLRFVFDALVKAAEGIIGR